MKKLALLSCLMLCITAGAGAQSYVTQQRAQEQKIRNAYKRGRVTPNEYYKLMREQDVIKSTIYKARRDGVITPLEQDRIDSKLARAEDRLARYKHNWER